MPVVMWWKLIQWTSPWTRPNKSLWTRRCGHYNRAPMQHTLLILLACFVCVLGAADPTLDQMEPNSGVNGAWVTQSATPMFRGTGPAGATIFVSAFLLIPPMPVLEQQRLVRVDPVGLWQTELFLSNGDYQIQVSANPLLTPLPIDGVSARQITVAARQQTSINSILPDGGVPNDFITGPGIITIVGRGEPGAQMQVSLSSVSTPTPVVIGVSTITANGTWSATTPAPLVAEQYNISAVAIDGAWSSLANRALSISDTAAALTLISLQNDSGSSSNDGVTTNLPNQMMLTISQGSLLSFVIPELDAVSDPTFSYQYFLRDGGDPTRPEIDVMFINDFGLSTFTYRAIATAPNGSSVEVSRIVQLDRTPVPLTILALGSNDGTNPNDDVVTTGNPVISGNTEPGAQLQISIRKPTEGGLPGGLPGLPGNEYIYWVPNTQVVVAADGSWNFSVPVNLPVGNLPYELSLSATRTLSGKTGGRNVPSPWSRVPFPTII